MAKTFKETVTILDADDQETITLDARRAQVEAGGNGKSGVLQLRDGAGELRAQIDSRGKITVADEAGEDLFEVDVNTGAIILRGSDGQAFLRIIAERGTLELGNTGTAGRLSVKDGEGREVWVVEGDEGSATIGAEGRPGKLKVLEDDGGLLLSVTSGSATLRGALIVGARENKGDIAVMGPMGRPAIHADGGNASLRIGNKGNHGELIIDDSHPRTFLSVDSLNGKMVLGSEGKKGKLVVNDARGEETAVLTGGQAAGDAGSGEAAGLFLGREGLGGEILALGPDGHAAFQLDPVNKVVAVGSGDNRVLIDGGIGDIKLFGADCAEEFELATDCPREPGTVLVIDESGSLEPCARFHDHRVAGVISGAGPLRPGIVLGRRDGENRVPVALSGRVYCKVDASRRPVRCGDLLTTSATVGVAEKADESGAPGAVLGKALADLSEGAGLIPVLVALQ